MRLEIEKIKEQMQQRYKRISTIVCATIFTIRTNMVAYAALSDIPLIKGTMTLLGDAQPLAIALGIAITGVLCIWRGIKWNAADDQEKPRAWKALWLTVVGGILITTAAGTLTGVCSYYTSGD